MVSLKPCRPSSFFFSVCWIISNDLSLNSLILLLGPEDTLYWIFPFSHYILQPQYFFSVLFNFFNVLFPSSFCPLLHKTKGLVQASWWEGMVWGWGGWRECGLVLVGRPFSVKFHCGFIAGLSILFCWSIHLLFQYHAVWITVAL